MLTWVLQYVNRDDKMASIWMAGWVHSTIYTNHHRHITNCANETYGKFLCLTLYSSHGHFRQRHGLWCIVTKEYQQRIFCGLTSADVIVTVSLRQAYRKLTKVAVSARQLRRNTSWSVTWTLATQSVSDILLTYYSALWNVTQVFNRKK